MEMGNQGEGGPRWLLLLLCAMLRTGVAVVPTRTEPLGDFLLLGGSFRFDATVEAVSARASSRIFDFGEDKTAPDNIVFGFEGDTGRLALTVVHERTAKSIESPKVLPLGELLRVTAVVVDKQQYDTLGRALGHAAIAVGGVEVAAGEVFLPRRVERWSTIGRGLDGVVSGVVWQHRDVAAPRTVLQVGGEAPSGLYRVPAFGGGVRFEATVTAHNPPHWSKIIDCGNGTDDSLYLAFKTPTLLILNVCWRETCRSVECPSPFPLGRAVRVVVTITDSGRSDHNGIPLGYAVVRVDDEEVAFGEVYLPRMVHRRRCLVGLSNWKTDRPFWGTISDVLLSTDPFVTREDEPGEAVLLQVLGDTTPGEYNLLPAFGDGPLELRATVMAMTAEEGATFFDLAKGDGDASDSA
eukprot:Sspe_Gene.9952::Locus_3347_Transcript_1_1_Confidence_1.000_Length_1260::g.9952::m.9952